MLQLNGPPQIIKPKRNTLNDIKPGSPSSMLIPTHWKRRQNACVRTKFCPRGLPGEFVLPSSNITTSDPENQASPSAAEARWNDHDPYIVVGIMGIHHSIPKERLLAITKAFTLFQKIRTACHKIRPWYRRLLSLKTVSSFGIYECNPVKGYHDVVDIDKQTSLILSEMYMDYSSGDPDYDDRWLHWVQKELNLGNPNPADGRYALLLVLKWSPFKIAMYGIASIILSLIIGFWYMWVGGKFPGSTASDMVGITQTAWTISSFILTAAGVGIALLAAITQIGDV